MKINGKGNPKVGVTREGPREVISELGAQEPSHRQRLSWVVFCLENKDLGRENKIGFLRS